MEDGVDKSIKDVIRRAKQEKSNMIRCIENLIVNTLNQIEYEITRVSKSYKDLATQLDLRFQSDEECKNIIIAYINGLTNLKKDLEILEINDTTILQSSVIEKAQNVVPLVEASLGKLREKFYTLNNNNLLKSYEQREQIRCEITNLKMRRMYLQGQLDVTRRKNKKMQIKQEISSLDDEIQILGNKLLEFKFHEEDALFQTNAKTVAEEQKNNRTVQVRQESAEIQKNQGVEKPLIKDDGMTK